MLDGLDPEQREVATALHGPVCVLAGAGTGKTRAITHRIAYGVRAGILQPASVLAVTFTNRAAGEMRGRLRQLGAGGVQARTFHSAALRQLQYFWPKVVGGELPRLLERKIQLVAEAAARCRIRLDRNELRDVTSEIEWAKVTQTVPADYPAAVAKSHRDAPRDPAEISQVYGMYEQLKRDRSVIDFEDVLLLTVGILQDRHDIADQIRRQYHHFVVDEYQDVSPLQQRLLDLWLGDRDSLCVVGDASQTIYSFTGATPDHLLNFRTRHPDATMVKLVRDYRSTPQVVHLANGLLSQARGRVAEHRLELISQREAGPEPAYTEYADEPAEAEGIARRIRDLIAAGVPAGEIAVLYRINAQSEVYEQALADAGVPYQLRGAERFFDRPEVREAGVALRGAARAGGNDSLLDDAEDLPAQVRAVLSTKGWTTEPPAGSGAVRDRWESLAALVRLAEDYVRVKPEATLADLVAELDERAAAQHAPTVQGVTRLAPLGEGPGVGRRVPGRSDRGHDAHHLREDGRAGRGGAPAALCRRHPRPSPPLPVLGALPLARRPRLPPPHPVPERDASRLGGPRRPGRGRCRRHRPRQRRQAQAARARPVPRLRQDAHRRGRDETDALRGLPLRHGRGTVRALARVAL